MKIILLFIFSFLFLISSHSQLVYDMDSSRNFAHSYVGINGEFRNITLGFYRREHIKLIHREVVGMLDISLPISEHFFTKHVFKKGFQIDLYKKENFLIPFMLSSSSISRRDSTKRYIDVTAEFSLNPTYIKSHFSIGLDLKYEIIAFRNSRYFHLYDVPVGKKLRGNYSRPNYDAYKFGLIFGYSFKHWIFYAKTGYQKNPFTMKNYLPGYFIFGLGYKFGYKPFKNKA